MMPPIHGPRLNYVYRTLQTAASLFDGDDLARLRKMLGRLQHNTEFQAVYNTGNASLERTLPFAFEKLSRVEEYSDPSRDGWGRFSFAQSSDSLDFGNGFLEPSVNLCLLNPLSYKPGIKAECTRAHEPTFKWFGDKDFCVALTHDVDILAQWTPRGIGRTVKNLLLNTLWGKWPRVYGYSRSILNFPLQTLSGVDPFFNVKEIARRERTFGFDSTFYFLFAHKHKLDGAEAGAYERLLGKGLEDVLTAGCEVGVHGSTLATEHFDQLAFERERCQKMTGATEIGLRFHNLRLDVRWTFDIIEKAGFLYDTTLGYPERSGWRNGFTFPYRPYSFHLERAYDFIEIPLVVMDGTFVLERYRNMPVRAAREEIFHILEIFKRWHGAGAITWHNHIFDPHLSEGYGQLYWEILKWIADNNGIGVSAMRLAKEWQRRERMVGYGTD